MALVDSRSYYGIYVKIHWVATAIFIALSGTQPLLIFGGALMVVGWHQTRERFYIGINLLIVSMAIIDGVLFLTDLHVLFSYIAAVNTVNVLIFYLLVIRETRVLKRPIFDLNDEEAARARHAFKTRNPADIESISKLKPWGDSLKSQ